MRTKLWKCILAIGWCSSLAVAAPYPPQVDHYTPGSLRDQARPLQEQAAKSTGSASETLQKYGVDFTMLSFRSQDGGAELHEKFADIFFVVDGSATLLTGGELANPTSTGPGEMRGTALLHATATHLSKGDIVHIPPNTPHQMLISSGHTLTYFVVKVKESD